MAICTLIKGVHNHLPGIQLEKGSVATPFEFRPYPLELQLCQRYYQEIKGWRISTYAQTDQYPTTTIVFNTMRTNPTSGIVVDSAVNSDNHNFNVYSTNSGALWARAVGTGTVYATGSKITLSAEL
jgi:hypothetical protein